MKHHDETSGAPKTNDEVDFSRALSRLESLIHEVISTGWDESSKRLACEMSAALRDASKAAGWKETSGILQALTSLLSLPLAQILPVREEIRERMLEFLGVLATSVRSRTA